MTAEKPTSNPAADPTGPAADDAVVTAEIVALRVRASGADGPPPDGTGPVVDALAAPPSPPFWSLAGFGGAAKPVWQPPVTGALAVIFGTAALFKMPLFMAPLAIALAIVAGLRGHHGWAVIGLATALVGLFTSAWFWTLLGLAWLYNSWG